ncbi:hypothetical protein [Brevibacillus parabrevis]|uniref:hypothetical protein n=1 Tax=Brevibacillus parabrevis TaxID=54914 RepID=UPI002E24E6AA|nr:hypothetical protein [Brevibacillus parabrevis]
MAKQLTASASLYSATETGHKQAASTTAKLFAGITEPFQRMRKRTARPFQVPRSSFSFLLQAFRLIESEQALLHNREDAGQFLLQLRFQGGCIAVHLYDGRPLSPAVFPLIVPHSLRFHPASCLCAFSRGWPGLI